MNRFPYFLLPLGLLAAGPAAAQTVVPALLEGDPIAGSGAVTRIDNLAVNNLGEWLVECDTDLADTNQDQALVKNGALYLHEGSALSAPAGATISSFDAININNNGDSGWNFFLDGTGGTNDDSGIYFNDLLVLQEGFISTSPAFSPNTPYIGFFEADVLPNDSNQILVVASIDDPAITSTVDRAIVRLTHDGFGNLVSEDVLMKEGDVPPGQVEFVADFGTGPHQSAFNDAGQALFFVDLNGSTATDGAIYLNNTLLAQEGSPSPVAGRNYELLSSRALDLSNSGAYVFLANLDGATTDDEVIIRNGSVLVREGDTLPGLGGFTFTSFGTGPVQISNAGDVLWYGDWNDPNTDVDTGLFLNDFLLVQEGVTTVDGIILDTIAGGQDAFALSRNGRWVMFEGVLLDGREGAFLIDLTGPVPVRLSGLTATPLNRSVVLNWTTSEEIDHVGFHVYRSEASNGAYERITVAGLVEGRGSIYQFTDTRVSGDHTYWYQIGAVDNEGNEEIFGPVSVTTPRWFSIRTALFPPMPNPLVRKTELRFVTEREGHVDLAIYDVAGRLVRQIVRGALPSGEHSYSWDGQMAGGERVPAGVYFSRLTADGATETQKVTVVGRR